MTNGQLNVVTVLPTTQMAVQGQIASAATSTDGIQQDGRGFAGMLSGIQSQATVKDVADSGQPEQPQGRNDKELSGRDAEKKPAVDLLALIQVSPQVILRPEPAAQQSEEPETADGHTDSEPLNSVSATAASQMAQAAYSQPGRMPEVNIPTQQAFDRLQNVAPVTEQPSVVAASPVEKQAGGMESMHTVSEQQIETMSTNSSAKELPPPRSSFEVSPSVQAVQSGRMPGVNTPTPLPVDRLQNGTLETEHQSVLMTTDRQSSTTVNAAEKELLKPAAYLSEMQPSVTVQPSPADGQTGTALVAEPAQQASQSDRMTIVSTLTTLSGDNQQKGTSEVGKQAPSASVPDETQVTHPVQVSTAHVTEVFAAKNASVAVADGNSAQHAAPAAEVPAKLSDKTVPVSNRLKGEVVSAGQDVAAPVSAQESDVEIQLSQPRPITARVPAVAVSSDNRFAALVQETRTARQRTNPEQEQAVVNKMASSQQTITSPEGVTVSFDPSRSGDGNQNQPDVASDNLMSVQDMHGQLKTEHQKIATFSTKQVPTEPVRESISEQVMHQVKERLVQHEVKPGNQHITLTLSPDSLGEVKMSLNLEGQKLSVEIVTESKAVRDSIVQHADALKDSLGRQNITMESFDVTTGGKGSGNQGQNQNAWRELAKQQQQQFWTSARGYAAAQTDLPAGNVAYMKQQGHSMLDIHY